MTVGRRQAMLGTLGLGVTLASGPRTAHAREEPDLPQPGIDVGLATVYRVLTQFEQAGLLSRQHFETGKAVFELNQGGHHDHLVCLQCGRVEEFYDSEIEKRQTDVARQRGFQLHGHSLALYADCIKQNCPYRLA